MMSWNDFCARMEEKCFKGDVGAKGEDDSEEKEMRKGRTKKSKGWWRRGDVGAYQNAGNMTCWAHRELAAVDEETRNNMRQRGRLLGRLEWSR